MNEYGGLRINNISEDVCGRRTDLGGGPQSEEERGAWGGFLELEADDAHKADMLFIRQSI